MNGMIIMLFISRTSRKNNVSDLGYLCMFNYDLTADGHMLNYAISSGHLDTARFLIKRLVGTNRSNKYHDRVVTGDIGCMSHRWIYNDRLSIQRRKIVIIYCLAWQGL